MQNFLKKIIKRNIVKVKDISITNTKEYPRHPSDFFSQICNKQILKLNDEFINLRKFNDNIDSIDYNKVKGSLSITIDDVGCFQFSFNPETSEIFYFSPLSGASSYYYNEVEDKFYSTRDEHLLEEMLVREILKVCKGYLNL